MQLLPIIASCELIGFIDDILPCPFLPSSTSVPPATPSTQYWIKRDQLLLIWLLASLSEDILPTVVGLRMARDVWLTLYQTFGAPSETRLLQLQMQLHNFKQQDSSISHFLCQAKYLSDELAAAGHPLSSSIFNVRIFNNLHSNFSSIIASLSARPLPVSFAELQSILISHEIRLQTQQTVATTLPIVNYTKSSSHSASSTASEISSRPRGRGRGRNRSSQMRRDPCPVCGQPGHSPYHCRYRHPGSLPSPGPPQAHAATHQSPVSTSPTTSILGEYHDWIPDTGATHHTTPNLSALSDVAPYAGNDHVLVGDGNRLSIQHNGSSFLSCPSRPLRLSNVLHVPIISCPLLFVRQFSRDNDCFFKFYSDIFFGQGSAHPSSAPARHHQ